MPTEAPRTLRKTPAEAIRTAVFEAQENKVKRLGPVTTLMIVLIALVTIGSLWISISALTEKVRLSHGLQQMIDIIAAAHEVEAQHPFDETKQEDLLDTLERLGHITTSGEVNGFKTLSNPWYGMVVATTATKGYARIETVMPAKICRRVVNLFDQNLRALGVGQIEIRNDRESWQPLYGRNQQTHLSDDQIAVGCSNERQTDMMLLFSLR